MSLITSLTRAWLTRSFKTFTFKSEYDQILPYKNSKNLGLYVHIPFCETICSFCPYCKVKYDRAESEKYIEALLSEIEMVGGQYQGRKQVTSLYFGGGSPGLVADRLALIISALQEHFDIKKGIGVELHPENVNLETLKSLKDAGVSKISIGIQSFQEKFQSLLGRKAVDAGSIRRALSEVEFETVSMDFIFALPGQDVDDLKSDIEEAFASGANHIAIYPFINFSFNEGQLPEMPRREKRQLLDEISIYCKNKGYFRDSIWTFSKDGGAGYSSMTRDNFLGFGCSATSLLDKQFKINTFSVDAYCKRIAEGRLATSLTIRFSARQRMVYYLFWTAYSTRVNPRDFENFFGQSLKKLYGFEFWLAKRLGFLVEEDGVYKMTLKGAFYYHYYENFYTLSYIDKMWGLMRKIPFPEELKL